MTAIIRSAKLKFALPQLGLFSQVTAKRDIKRQMRALANMDTRMLSDIGITAEQRDAEIARHF